MSDSEPCPVGFIRDLMREPLGFVAYRAIENGLVLPEQLEECLVIAYREAFRRPLAAILVERGYLDPQTAARLGEPPKRAPERTPPEVIELSSDPGRRLGKFTLVQEIGHGGAGRVWKAWDGELGRWVAVKLLTHEGKVQQERFLREARTAARLSHPSVAAIYEVGEQDGRPYIVMQFIDGRSLAGLRTSPREALEAVAPVADALEFAHRHKVIHRDLKPGNVLRDRDGRIYVVDFGLAREVDAGLSLTVAGAIVGTPVYMSPEQAAGRLADLDERTDVYGLGAILYELLTGRPPHSGRALAEIIRNILTSEPIRPRGLRPDIHPDIEAICLKALERNRALRYAGAAEFRDDVRRFLDGQPVRAVRLSPWRRAARWSRRRVLPLAAAAGIAASLTLGVWTWLASRRALQEADAQRRAAAEHARQARSATEEAAHREQVWRELVPIQDSIQRLRSHFRRPAFDRDAFERDRQEVLAALENLKQRLKEAPEIDYLIGTLRMEWGEWDEAERAFQAALSARSDYTAARIQLTRLWLQIVQWESMVKWSSSAFSEERRAAALRELEQLEASSIPGPELEPLRSLVRGLEHMLKQEWTEAEATFHEGWKQSGDEDLAVWLAVVLHLTGRYDEALETVTTVLSAKPWHVLALQTRAAFCYSFGNLEKGRADVERGLLVNPRLSWFHFALGCEEVTRRRWDEAERHFTRCIEVQPDSARGYAERGFTRMHLRDLQAAREDCDRAIALDPRWPPGYSVRGTIRKRQGDLDGAYTDFEAALALDPNLCEGLSGRGDILRMRGEYEAALRDLNRAHSLKPNSYDILSRRGMTYFGLGRNDEAIRDLERACQINAEPEQLILDTLKQLREARKRNQ